MRLCDALKEKELDLRIRDRHLAEGKLRPQEVEIYLKSLVDERKNLVELSSQSTSSSSITE